MPFKFSPACLKMPATQQLDGDEWVLEQPFLYIVPGTGERVIVPPSGLGSLEDMLAHPVWTTDYGSIPALFQNIFKRDGDYGPAYVLHDWLYQSERFSRAKCDWILLCAMQELGAWWTTRNTVYSAVRVNGWVVWAAHEREEVQRCKRYRTEFGILLNSGDSPWPELKAG